MSKGMTQPTSLFHEKYMMMIVMVVMMMLMLMLMLMMMMMLMLMLMLMVMAMTIQPKRNQSLIRSLKQWKLHPENMFGNVLPPKSLFPPKP